MRHDTHTYHCGEKYLEARSKDKTANAVNKLVSLAPKTAVVIRDSEEMEVPAENVMVGDVFLLKAGWSVPCDGVLIDGNCTVDQSALTGESIPVDKAVGDRVMSASVSAGGFAKVRCEKQAKDSTLSQIIALVEDASASKSACSKACRQDKRCVRAYSYNDSSYFTGSMAATWL